MSLNTYIREEQHFMIFIHTESGAWETYNPSIHGPAESIRRGYVVAYADGEIVDNQTNVSDLPEGTRYIREVPYKVVKMPECVEDDPRITISHEPSAYHKHGHYCTRLKNSGKLPFRILRFSAFSKTFLLGGYRLSTISNEWFSRQHFMSWYNLASEWIEPGCIVVDQDNFGFGNGYWVFDVEFSDKTSILVKTRLPTKELNPTDKPAP